MNGAGATNLAAVDEALEHTDLPATGEAQVDAVLAQLTGLAGTGPAEHVEIEFDSRVAPYVRARVWHASQQMKELPEGGIVLALDVCHDWALRSWILGFGSAARVIAPDALREAIEHELRVSLARYRAR